MDRRIIFGGAGAVLALLIFFFGVKGLLAALLPLFGMASAKSTKQEKLKRQVKEREKFEQARREFAASSALEEEKAVMKREQELDDWLDGGKND